MVNMVLRTVIISSHQNLKMDKNRDFHSLIRFSIHLVFSTEPLAEQKLLRFEQLAILKP